MNRRPQLKRSFEHLAQRVFNVPLMIEERKAEIICAALHQRLGLVQIERLDGTTLEASNMLALAGDARRNGGDDWRPFHADGPIAVIPIDGTLVHKFGWLDPMSGCTGYDGIAKKLRAALRDDSIKAIWFDVDSPGGEVAGCFALATEIAKATQSEGGSKPIWAYVNEQACSAAYALTCVCDRVYGPADAIAGSIGSYVLHVDFSKAFDKNGIKATMIRAGKRKARGNSVEPLDKEQLTKLQAWVDDTRERFAELVAMGRRMKLNDVLATEGDWFTAAECVELGLIDGIMSESDAWAELMKTIRA